MSMGVPDWLIRSMQDAQYAAAPMSVPPEQMSSAGSIPADVIQAAYGNAAPPNLQAPGGNVAVPQPLQSATTLDARQQEALSGPPVPSGGVPSWLQQQALQWNAPSPAAPEQAAPAAPKQTPEQKSNMALILEQAMRGNQQYVPGGFKRTGYAITQTVPGAMPGTDDDDFPDRELERTLAEQPMETRYGAAERALGEREDMARLGQEQTQEDRMRSAENEERNYAMQVTEQEMKVEEYKNEQRRRQAFVEQQIPKLEQLMEQRVSEQAKNPATSYFEDKSFGGRLATSIALGLSTLGSGLTGSENVVLKMIQDEINGDILKQRQRTEALGMRFAQGRALYADMLAQFRSPEAAENATRYALESAALLEVRRQAAKEKGIEAQANINAIGDKLELQRAETKKNALTGAVNTLYQDVPGRVVGQPGGIDALAKKLKEWGVPAAQIPAILATMANKGSNAAGGMLDSGTDAAMSDEERRTFQLFSERRVRLPDSMGGGNAYSQRTPKATEELQAKLDDVDGVLKNLSRMEQMVSAAGTLSPTTRQELNILAQTNMLRAKNSEGLGAITEADQRMVGPVVLEGIEQMSIADRAARVQAVRRHFLERANEAKRLLSKDKLGKEPLIDPIVTRQVK